MAKMTVTSRDISGKKVKNIRAEGLVPAAMFGPEFESTNVAVKDKEFRKVYAEAGHSAVVDVVDDEGVKNKIVFKEVQQHPVSDEILHISMYVVDPTKEITAEIPVEFVGRSPIEEEGSGFVAYGVATIPVRCLPDDLPAVLEVDLTQLTDPSDTILISGVELPEGVELDSKADGNAAVAFIAQAQKLEDVLEEIEQAREAETEIVGEEGEEVEGEEVEGEVQEGEESEGEEGDSDDEEQQE